jgi:hypothetical protein
MCQTKECEHEKDAKGCALKHIGKARNLLKENKVKEADTMLKYAEDHLNTL